MAGDFDPDHIRNLGEDDFDADSLTRSENIQSNLEASGELENEVDRLIGALIEELGENISVGWLLMLPRLNLDD